MFIDNWSVQVDGKFALATGLERITLKGNIYGDKNFMHGQYIETNPIRRLDNEYLVCFNEYRFKLGLIDRAYSVAFPHARIALLEQIKVNNY